jgi:hypothetical protein
MLIGDSVELERLIGHKFIIWRVIGSCLKSISTPIEAFSHTGENERVSYIKVRDLFSRVADVIDGKDSDGTGCRQRSTSGWRPRTARPAARHDIVAPLPSSPEYP